MKVEIVGLHKADVLLALYNNAKFNGQGFASQPMMRVLANMAPPANREAAVAAIDRALGSHNCYFDYVDLGSGPRPIKADLSGFDFDPTLYDRDHGYTGYAAEIIGQLRSQYISQLSSEPAGSMAHLLSQIGLVFQNRSNPSTGNDRDYDSDNDSTLSNS